MEIVVDDGTGVVYRIQQLDLAELVDNDRHM